MFNVQFSNGHISFRVAFQDLFNVAKAMGHKIFTLIVHSFFLNNPYEYFSIVSHGNFSLLTDFFLIS